MSTTALVQGPREYFVPGNPFTIKFELQPATGEPVIDPDAEWRIRIQRDFVAKDLEYTAATSPALSANANGDGVIWELTVPGSETKDWEHFQNPKLILEAGPCGDAQDWVYKPMRMDPSGVRDGGCE